MEGVDVVGSEYGSGVLRFGGKVMAEVWRIGKSSILKDLFGEV